MNVSQAIWQRLAQEIDTVFYLPGGGCAPLVDSLGQSGIKHICCLSEQGAGFAAVGYAQHKGFGVALCTSGPGVTNMMTPCLAAWLDSVPVLFISGQVMVKWLAAEGMRSRGTQEAPTFALVKPITKARWMSNTGEACLQWFDWVIGYAKDARPGPVWLDVPMDVQSEEI